MHGADSIYGSPNLWLDSDGVVIAKRGFRISQLNGAAYFKLGTPAPTPGDVVVLYTGNDVGGMVAGDAIQSSSANDTTVIGVAMDWNSSDPPGFILDDQPNPQVRAGTTSIVVALMGIVMCHVDATNNAIKPGDLLTTSNTPGYAQKVDQMTPRGAVFAKALDSIPSQPGSSSIGTIRVLMMLS